MSDVAAIREQLGIKDTDERYTPRWLLDIVISALGPLAYDPCTAPHNPAGAIRFACPPVNGLETSWQDRGGVVWVNPPFSNGNLAKWANKCAVEADYGVEIVLLTPVDPSTGWYSSLSYAAQLAAALKRRPEYGKPDGAFGATAKQPAMLWYFGHRTKHFARCMAEPAHCWVPGGTW
jgi:hypothetical protein